MKIMVEAETAGERQCTAFAAEVFTEVEMAKKCTSFLVKERSLIADKKAAEKKADDACRNSQETKEDSYYQSNHSKGGDRRQRDQRRDRSRSRRRNKPDAGKGGDRKKYCKICADYFREKGLLPEKDYVVRNHNTQECTHKKRDREQPKDDRRRPDKGPRKSNDKNRGGKGKQRDRRS
jgi:hypothetical protein